MNLSDRYRGALLGLAVGDALGTTLEFARPGSFAPITDMVGGGRFGLQPGQWADDTSMALCLAESLIECQGFDPVDQLTRYCRWWREGHLSSTGVCFDIGTTTRAALVAFEETQDPYPGPDDPRTAGNGSLMRLAPIPLFFPHRPARSHREGGPEFPGHARGQGGDGR
jgi:ADP-ribosylglycohydrolase